MFSSAHLDMCKYDMLGDSWLSCTDLKCIGRVHFPLLLWSGLIFHQDLFGHFAQNRVLFMGR